MSNPFAKYMKLREDKEEAPVVGVTSHIKLQKKNGGNDFSPFVIDKSNHANLAPIVKAFLDSDKVRLGYTTIDKNKGEVEPQLKKKSLYLTGGAVRDHLLGKTARNYDLVTDATVSEIRMILKSAGFKEVRGQIDGFKYEKLPNITQRKKQFYVSRVDGTGKEMEVVAIVKNQPFPISTLSKSPKSKKFTPNDAKAASSIEEDASNRDFTINAMYIPLSNEDGSNSDLIDPFGGANHLKSGEIKAIGDKFSERLSEDPMTAFRFLNHFNRYGKGDKIPENYSKSISSCDKLKNYSDPSLKDEFIKGLEHPDIDTKRFLKTYHSSGLLNLVFPNIEFNLNDIPPDLRGDRWMVAAWILRNNNPTDVKDMLVSGGWAKQEANDVSYLVKMHQWGKNRFDTSNFYDMIQSHTGLTKSKVKEWMKVTKTYGSEVDNFLNFDAGDLNPYQSDDSGLRKVNPTYVKFLGRSPMGGEFDTVKSILMTNRWSDMIKPK
jgi:hypothetical protein